MLKQLQIKAGLNVSIQQIRCFEPIDSVEDSWNKWKESVVKAAE